jgi:hypothetical protein
MTPPIDHPFEATPARVMGQIVDRSRSEIRADGCDSDLPVRSSPIRKNIPVFFDRKSPA